MHTYNIYPQNRQDFPFPKGYLDEFNIMFYVKPIDFEPFVTFSVKLVG